MASAPARNEDSREMEAETDGAASQAAEEVFRTPEYELSPSVEGVSKLFAPGDPVSAARLAGALLENHLEYGGELAQSILPLEDTPKTRPFPQWLADVEALLDAEKMREQASSTGPVTLHGRLFLVGLALLEPALRTRLEENDFLALVIKEIREPLPEILSAQGLRLLEGREIEFAETVPTQPDEPLEKIVEDQLGRAAFAKYLARRIQAVPLDSGAYSFHIYGPWGSGKSTLLNFLKEDLEGTGRWMVTEFNAWRNQHIRPPWWSLMERVFRRTKGVLPRDVLISEYWWRFNTGRLHYIFGGILLLWAFVLLILPSLLAEVKSTSSTLANFSGDLSKIIALLLTLWGLFVGIGRSLLFGSAQAAKTYMELTHDPMDTIKRRFKRLMQHIRPQRTAVFIDDLDRCQGDYVIELLEGMQTIFKEAPVIFVVAADRGWLNACYEQAYKDFQPIVHEPGKPLGTLFLEKAFQFSTPIPGIPIELKEAFWRNLVQVQAGKEEHTLEEARGQARELMAGAESEGAVLRVVDGSRNRSFFEQRAIREEAVVRLAAPEVVERTEHALIPFAGLLDANPRSMKRLVNSYSVNRAMATLSHIDIQREHLVLWTILSLRWPELADYLEQYPEKITAILTDKTDECTESIVNLCRDPEVRLVIEGGSTGFVLSDATVRQCSMLWV